MSSELSGRTIAFIATDGVEAVELSDPWDAVSDAGGSPVLLSIDSGQIQGFDHLEPGERFDVDGTIADADPADYDGVLLPGGVANPDRLRTDKATVAFVRSTVESGTPVGVICHGPWTLINAGVVSDRHITSWPSLRIDLINAGADWVDEPVVVCDNGPNVLVSSRNPGDLEVFCSQIVAQFSRAGDQVA